LSSAEAPRPVHCLEPDQPAVSPPKESVSLNFASFDGQLLAVYITVARAPGSH